MFGEDFAVKLGEGSGKRLPRLVGGSEPLHCIGVTEEFPCLVDERADCLVENNAADRNRGLGRSRVSQFGQSVSGRKGDVIDFGEIMIFAGQPEDG